MSFCNLRTVCGKKHNDYVRHQNEERKRQMKIDAIIARRHFPFLYLLSIGEVRIWLLYLPL